MAHRNRLDDTQRTRVPVPVLLTAHSWDPNTCSVRDWLRDQLVATYPLFGHRGGRAEAAALVRARDKVALILDGLDEMTPTLRPAALQALSDAPFRVVVLTRSEEMVQAASGAWLAGAITVHLHDVTAAEAIDYLQRARTGPPPRGWRDLLTHLGQRPDGVLARGLSTPLTLTLLRDTYQAGDDVRDLLDPARYRTTDAIEHHLIARALPAAYTPRPGRPPPRYTEQQARQTLSFIARTMGKDRDLVWRHIRHWAPAAPRILATGLVFGLAAGLWSGLAGGLAVGVGCALVFGLVGPATWQTRLAWLHLQLSPRVPAVSLMPFLEDARERDILRIVGTVYQFRHATLQDHLASQATASSPTPSTVLHDRVP